MIVTILGLCHVVLVGRISLLLQHVYCTLGNSLNPDLDRNVQHLKVGSGIDPGI